ncbi:hypothetical protein TSUD_129260 [Trifolium subterraneum]|uniref:Uncharacterized protein n=1 Tax=Trifolium subterraneum TaxID=3900 RepID=A0A1B5Z891_TRISU|nr:hypothetical protein TSUD_129260 [Trifolium subterraneum]
MAEIAVSLVIDQLIPLLRKETKLFRGIHKEFADIKDELESIQAFLKDADERAEGDNTGEGVKTWVKQVRDVAFRIEDIIDEYLIQVVQQPRVSGCLALLHKLKTMTPRRQIAHEIQDIKSSVRGISERSERYGLKRSLEQGSSNARESRNAKWHDPRLAALYIEEAEVVGFEAPRKTLIDWMVKGREERTVVSVVGMGGQGKTTLAKKVFDDKDIIRHFDCRVWITVSQSYKIEELLRDMLLKFHKQKGDIAPRDISQMDRASLIEEVRNYLQQKRYLIVFDDVWSSHFWDDIEFALIDNKNGKDYEVNLKRVTRQWIAEGFVKEERGKTLEEVAEEYLTELIHRSLVQVSSLRIDGKAKCCRIHDLIRNMILDKIEDLNFGKHISKDGQSSLSGITRRLSTTSSDLIECIESSHIRSLLFFTTNDELEYFNKKVATKYRLLKVLDYQSVPLWKVPDKLGILNHLKYLSFRHTIVSEVPKSIGMLHNLETLDLRNYKVIVLPKEISKLRKLRHLIGDVLSLVQLKDGIGEMTSLQTLRFVNTDIDGAVEVIKELGKLKQIRVLGLYVCAKYGSIVSSSLNEMQHLEKLNVRSSDDEAIDLNLISSRTMLQNLTLNARLQKLPKWIPELQNLVVLGLINSRLTKDPMESLKFLQHLLFLSLHNEAYEGLHLHVEAGGFQKLKELYVTSLNELQDIIIDKGALPSLKNLSLLNLPRLKHIPTGIKHLEKLEALHIFHMQVEFVEHNSTEDWIMEHVPLFEIETIGGNVIQNSRS